MIIFLTTGPWPAQERAGHRPSAGMESLIPGALPLPPHVGPVRNWKEIQDTSDLRPSKRIPVLRPLYRTGSLCLVM